MLNMKKNNLIRELIRSNTLHGARIYDGDIFIHPDELLRRAKLKGKRLCLRIIKGLERKVTTTGSVIDVT